MRARQSAARNPTTVDRQDRQAEALAQAPEVTAKLQIADGLDRLRHELRLERATNQQLEKELQELRTVISDEAKLREVVTRAEEHRIQTLLFEMACSALRRIQKNGGEIWKNSHYRHVERNLESVFVRTAQSKTAALLRISKTPPSREKEWSAIKERRNTARRQLAAELKSGRFALRRIKDDLNRNAALLRVSMATIQRDMPQYPIVPGPMIESNEEGRGLPAASGIYFVWSGGVVVYVGQSIRLCDRVKCRHHDAVWSGDWISWLEVSPDCLNWTESFYIGVCRPIRNFGGVRKIRTAVSAAAMSHA